MMRTITQLIAYMSSWLSKCKHEVMMHFQQWLTPGISSQSNLFANESLNYNWWGK